MQLYAEEELDPVLRTVVSHWLNKITASRDHKKRVFQDAANECLSYYNGPRSWEEAMGGEAGMNQSNDIVDPMFKVSVNKTFEYVSIFGPTLYYENPVRTVKPRMPVVVPPQFFPDPMLFQSLIQQENLRVMQEGLISVLLEAYLNWTPIEFSLEKDGRLGVNEALISGRGCLWTELYSPPGSQVKVVRTLWDTTDHLYCDPDAYRFDQAQWIARKCIHPVWQVERDFGLRPGSLKGNMESNAKQADIADDEDMRYDRQRGLTNDLLVYYKIYSKMGLGGRLSGMRKDFRGPLEMFGDYCYIVVAENVPFPLNLCPDITNDPEFAANPNAVFARTSWPTPFWAKDWWPVSVLDFHPVKNQPWPLPPLKAGMGELKFLNWCMSFLMGKIRNTTRDFIAIKKEAGEEIKNAILEGKDLTLIELESAHGTISELVQFLQHPEVNGDIWRMIDAVENNFDKRVGLTELMYGDTPRTQDRSAEASAQKANAGQIRPDDMRKQVDSWMSEVAAKEALTARYHLVAADVQSVFGAMGAWAWANFVATKDVQVAVRQLEYRIEAGSTQRPNKNWEMEVVNKAFQALAPILQTYGQATADLLPLNNLLGDYAKAMDLDPGRYQLRAAMMPAAPGGAPGEEDQGSDTGHQSQATTNVPPPG